MENNSTRRRLGSQISAARREKSWTIQQVSRRTGRAGPRLSAMETGKANSTIDTLEAVGRAVDLQLLFVPDSRMEEVLDLINRSRPSASQVHAAIPSIFDEVFIDEEDDEDDVGAGL